MIEVKKRIPKGAFQKCFEDWKKRLHKYIISLRGGYLEGDKIVIDRSKINTI